MSLRQEMFLTFYFWAEDFLKSFVKRIKIHKEENWAPASCNADVVSVCFSEEDSEERPQCGRGSGSGTQQQDGGRQSLSCDCSRSINRRTIDYRDWTLSSSSRRRETCALHLETLPPAHLPQLFRHFDVEIVVRRFLLVSCSFETFRCSRGNVDAELRSYWEMSLRWLRCRVSVQNWKCESDKWNASRSTARTAPMFVFGVLTWITADSEVSLPVWLSARAHQDLKTELLGFEHVARSGTPPRCFRTGGLLFGKLFLGFFFGD